MEKNILSEFWKLLNQVEDFYATGFEDKHNPLSGDEGPGRSNGADGSGRPAGSADSLEQVRMEVSQCTLCPLYRERRQAVAGEGSGSPLVLMVGEGPGAEEDRTGRPFVGPAGRYLDRWLAAVVLGNDPESTLSRDTNTYITNVVKCRPPGNRDPLPEEIQTCLPYLERQVELLKPKAILTLGRVALHTLAQTSGSLGSLRGRLYSYKDIPLVPTYHPSAVLRELSLQGRRAQSRAAVWEDLKRLKALLENEPLR